MNTSQSAALAKSSSRFLQYFVVQQADKLFHLRTSGGDYVASSPSESSIRDLQQSLNYSLTVAQQEQGVFVNHFGDSSTSTAKRSFVQCVLCSHSERPTHAIAQDGGRVLHCSLLYQYRAASLERHCDYFSPSNPVVL